jgi:CCR4-NOT transcription complex subunit 2
MMGGSGSGSFPRPAAVAGSPMGAGGADLLAMINKQQHGGANLAAFGGGGNAFMGAGGASGRGDDGAAPPGFDLNDFPSLGDSGNPGGPSRQMSGGMGLDAGGAAGAGSGFGARANPGGLHPGGFFGGMDGMGSADGYGVVSLQKPHPEFTMQNEDFPALPGAPGMGGSPAGKSAAADRRAFSRGGVFVPSATRSNGGFPGPERVVGAAGSEYGEPLGSIESCVSSNAASNGSHGGRGVGPVPNVSVSIGGRSGGTVGGGSDDGVGTSHLGRSPRRDSEVETFGLLGLLGVIRMSDPDVTTLRLGTDLTTLGLNLNSPEPLYRTFGSPWSDAAPLRELELAVPACYAVRARPLSPSTFAKFQQETLFYVFYGSPGEEAQARAADELVNRGWGFHKELKAWLTRVAGAEPARRTARGERGSFWIFDANVWEKVRKDNFNLQYDVLERRPFVPGKDGGKEASSFGSLAGAGLE